MTTSEWTEGVSRFLRSERIRDRACDRGPATLLVDSRTSIAFAPPGGSSGELKSPDH